MVIPPGRYCRGAVIAATLLAVWGCGDSPPSPSPSPTPTPTPGAPAPVPGATPVTGSERLAWTQAGDASGLRFVAYVDDTRVGLGAACNCAASQTDCSSPLPPLTDGVHTIALAAVSSLSGLESLRSESITVQKLPAGSAVSAASFPDARVATGGARLETVVTAASGHAFAADVVARGLQAPLQLAAAPDGRVFVAEASGRVRVVRPGEPMGETSALDAPALLDPPPAGPLGLALHPAFARNHFVYVAFLAQEQPGRTRLRIVRLREAGDRLGEPATLFEAPITVAVQDPSVPILGAPSGLSGGLADGAPHLAFGPDGLLYVLLPPGAEFDREPSASRPLASMLRLEDDGRAPEAGPLSGITAHPIGFAWHPATSELWVMAPGRNGTAVLRPVSRVASGTEEVGLAVLRFTDGHGEESGALAFEPTATPGALAAAFAADLNPASFRTVRLVTPILIQSVLTGMSGRIGDVVADSDGTLFLATRTGSGPANEPAIGGDVIVRLRPRPSP